MKVLRYGMPIILQATVLMMDNSFDVLPEEPDDPTKLLRRICDRQKQLIDEANEIIEKGKSDDVDNDERLKEVAKLYENMVEFNKVELCNGIGEALDVDDKKKTEVSMCARIFKMLIGVSLLGAMINYILFGP